MGANWIVLGAMVGLAVVILVVRDLIRGPRDKVTVSVTFDDTEVVVIVNGDGSPGAQDAIREMQRRLIGFDNRAFLDAMGMTSGGVEVWQRA